MSKLKKQTTGVKYPCWDIRVDNFSLGTGNVIKTVLDVTPVKILVRCITGTTGIISGFTRLIPVFCNAFWVFCNNSECHHSPFLKKPF